MIPKPLARITVIFSGGAIWPAFTCYTPESIVSCVAAIAGYGITQAAIRIIPAQE